MEPQKKKGIIHLQIFVSNFFNSELQWNGKSSDL